MVSEFRKNAGIGAVTTAVTALVPILQFVAPIIGGGVAGWRADLDRVSSAKLGAVSGGLASLLFAPLLLIGLAVTVFDFGITFVTMLIFTLPIAAMLMLFGALGGYLGAVVSESKSESESDFDVATTPDVETTNPNARSDGSSDRLRQLKDRYAAGDLTEEEFEARVDQVLRDSSELDNVGMSRETEETAQNE